MLKRLTANTIWLLVLTPLLAFSAQEDANNAGAPLQAKVDRNTLYSNETLTLEIQGSSDMGVSLGSLFRLQGLDVPTPDLGDLEEDFRILNRNQHMSVRSVNDEHSAHITWTFMLAPKRSGELTIPPLHFEGQSSEPMTITVYPGVAPGSGGDSTASRMEVHLSDDDVYVQQQLTLTQKLYYQPPLISGTLPAPEIDNAIVEMVGEQKEYREEHSGVEWQLVERTYAVVPQSTGTLVVPPLEFQGRKRDSRGAVAFLRAQSPEKRLLVRPPPESFSGDVWLPAASLDIREDWSGELEDLEAGESITRDLQLRALGVLPEALPTLDIGYPDNLREYPDPVVTDSRFTEDKLESNLRRSAALVPLEAGAVQLPEIRIPWWDVINDKERVAVVPSRTIQIQPAPGMAGNEEKEKTALIPASGRPPGARLPVFWFWLALILATGWLVTGLAWWLNRRRQGQSGKPLTVQQKEQRQRFRALCQSARQGQAEALSLLPRWAAVQFDQPELKTVADVTRFANDPTLSREIDALQRHLFAPSSEQGPWDGRDLVASLRRLAGQPVPGQKTPGAGEMAFNEQPGQP
ncbi:MAG: BatD family protein [Oleiphilaceae bacterium]|nr:BatD family protein [Oleiphilaceae bacterium]